MEKEKKKEDSIKKIVMRHIDRISKYIFSGENEGGTSTDDKDRRIVIMQSIDFLIALLKNFYDSKMEEIQNKFDEIITEEDINLDKSAISGEAYNRVMEERKRGLGGEELQNQLKAWNNFLISNSIIVLNKDSAYYELYIVKKYKNYMILLNHLNKLINRSEDFK